MGRLRILLACVLLTVALVSGCNNQELTENQESRIEQGQTSTAEVPQDTASETAEDEPQGEYLCMVWTLCPDERPVPGFLKTDGTWLFEPGAFGWLGNFRYGLAAARCLAWGDYGFIDASGSWIIEAQYLRVRGFSEGLAAVQDLQWEGWGFIDDNGNYIIESQFLDVQSFSEGLAWAQAQWEQWGAIDKSGNWVIEPRFENMPGNFLNGYASARCPYVDLMGTVDKNGNWAISPIYRYMHRIGTDGEIFASVSTDGTDFWLIDKTGTQIIKIGSEVRFSEGLAAVAVNDPSSNYILVDVDTHIIDENGSIVAEVTGFYPDGIFSDGLLHVREGGRHVGGYICFRSGSRGFVDRDGNWVIGPTETSGDSQLPWDHFSEGFSVQRAENGMWGYVDKNGNWAIEPQFERAYRFSQGLAVARKELASMVIINTDGEAISPIIPLPSKFHNLTGAYFNHQFGEFEFRFQETVRRSDASAVLDAGSSSADSGTESIEETGQQVIDSILNGDFSHLAGEWIDGYGRTAIINADGTAAMFGESGYFFHGDVLDHRQEPHFGYIDFFVSHVDDIDVHDMPHRGFGASFWPVRSSTTFESDSSRERLGFGRSVPMSEKELFFRR